MAILKEGYTALNDYIICYDITDPKRLKKLARLLEKSLFRFQYSMFIAKNYTKDQIYLLCEEIISIIDPNEDDVRVYKIKEYGETMGQAYDLDDIFLFI